MHNKMSMSAMANEWRDNVIHQHLSLSPFHKCKAGGSSSTVTYSRLRHKPPRRPESRGHREPLAARPGGTPARSSRRRTRPRQYSQPPRRRPPGGPGVNAPPTGRQIPVTRTRADAGHQGGAPVSRAQVTVVRRPSPL